MSRSLRHIWLAGALIAFALPSAVLADDFKLGMVIKSTTNPYYNATLAGAKIAENEWTLAAHALGVALHVGERGAIRHTTSPSDYDGLTK